MTEFPQIVKAFLFATAFIVSHAYISGWIYENVLEITADSCPVCPSCPMGHTNTTMTVVDASFLDADSWETKNQCPVVFKVFVPVSQATSTTPEVSSAWLSANIEHTRAVGYLLFYLLSFLFYGGAVAATVAFLHEREKLSLQNVRSNA